MPILPVAQDRVSKRIGDAIKRQISSGHLGPGAKLPSTRTLAAEWGVSRSTVTLAYDQLIAEGYLDVRQGARTRVALTLNPQGARPEFPPAVGPSDRLSAFARRLAGFPMPIAVADPGSAFVDFRYGDLAGDDYPVLAWRKAIGAAALRRRVRLRYGDPSGLPELRTALQAYLWRARRAGRSLRPGEAAD